MDEPSLNDGQPEKIATKTPVESSEPCAMVTGERDVSSTPTNEGLLQYLSPMANGQLIGSTQMPTNSQCLLEIPNAQTREEEDENAPGSVGGVLSFEILPPPDVSEKDSMAKQESEVKPQVIVEKCEPVIPAKTGITYPKNPPMQRSWYCYDDFRNDHLDMYACSCPKSTTIRPPRWFGYLFGTLTLAFCMPFLTGAVCCNAMCQGKPKQHIRVDFQLPLWLTTSICLSILYWDSTYGLDRFFQWRRLREVEDSEAALAIEIGDIRWLQRQVAAKRLLPFDVLKGIGDPLAVSGLN